MAWTRRALLLPAEPHDVRLDLFVHGETSCHEEVEEPVVLPYHDIEVPLRRDLAPEDDSDVARKCLPQLQHDLVAGGDAQFVMEGEIAPPQPRPVATLGDDLHHADGILQRNCSCGAFAQGNHSALGGYPFQRDPGLLDLGNGGSVD